MKINNPQEFLNLIAKKYGAEVLKEAFKAYTQFIIYFIISKEMKLPLPPINRLEELLGDSTTTTVTHVAKIFLRTTPEINTNTLKLAYELLEKKLETQAFAV